MEALEQWQSLRSFAEGEPEIEVGDPAEEDTGLDPLVEALLEEEEEEEEEGEEHSYAAPGLTLQPSKKNPKVRRWIRSVAVKQAIKRHLVASAAATAGGMTFGPVGGVLAGGVMAAHEKAVGKLGDSPGHYEYWMKYHGNYVRAKAKEHGVTRKAVASALAAHGTSAFRRHALKRGLRHALVADPGEVHEEIARQAKAAFEKNIRKAARS